VKCQNLFIKLKYKLSDIYKSVIGKEWLLAIVIAVAVVVVGSVISLESHRIIAVNSPQYIHYSVEPHNRLKVLANWDGVDYIKISRQGYTNDFSTGWLPLYPLLIYIFDIIFNSSLMSSLIIAWVCLAGAIYYYLKVFKLLFKVKDNIKALKAAVLFILFPSGIYFIAAYTESIFAFLSLGAIYYALQKKYLPAALLTMFATAPHINGAFLLLLVVLILYEEKVKIRNLLITMLVGSLGLVSFMTFLLIRYHNPFEFISAQRDHGWLHTSFINRLGSFNGIDLIFAAAILLTVIYWWNRRRSFALYSALYLLIPLIGGQFGGYPRYTLMVFPLPLMLYEYCQKKKLLYPAIMLVFILSWVYILLRFTAGYVVS
jgi:Gpi18-like mannosyltransferase